MRRSPRRLLAFVFCSCALSFAACGDDSDKPAVETGESNNTANNDGPVCPEACPSATQKVADSAARCGFRCVADAEEEPDPADPRCEQGCPEGTVRRSSPQELCGFFCEVTVEEPPAAAFQIQIENISGGSGLSGSLSPGVWALTTGDAPLFAAGQVASPALALLAEEGQPAELASAVRRRPGTLTSGVFSTPEGALSPGALPPGGRYLFSVEADPAQAPQLSLAAGFLSSNDVFLGTAGAGLPLFDADGAPLPAHTVEVGVAFWDAGSEANERPGQGPNQPGRPSGVGAGRAEGRIGRFSDTTRALAPAAQLVEVSAEGPNAAGVWTITVLNRSAGPTVTGMSPVFFATHAAGWRLFTPDAAASIGLGALASDGDPAPLVTALMELATSGEVGATAAGLEAGGSVSFEVAPTTAHPWLSVAAALAETNDTFWASPGAGVKLLEESGQPRLAADVTRDLRALNLWDAGVEANAIPGIGADQLARQEEPGVGDPGEGAVKPAAAEVTNDYAALGALITVEVIPQEDGSFEVTLRHTGDGRQAISLSEIVWGVHSDALQLFTDGAVASDALGQLAAEGEPAPLLEVLEAGGVALLDSGLEAAASGGLAPGESITFVVTPDAAHRRLSLAARLSPSNDALVALAPGGLALLDAAGPRSAEALRAEASLMVWDVGVEQNESAALGAGQATVGAGRSEGTGLIRPVEDGWWYPAWDQVVRITITPATL